VDDATGGASSIEAAKEVSQDMEDILGNGGFRFKETVMSGDPLGKVGELRKVLGLRWDTQRDEICVNVKLNYGEKVKGLTWKRMPRWPTPRAPYPSHNTQGAMEGSSKPV
jgi:hypothetical protein